MPVTTMISESEYNPEFEGHSYTDSYGTRVYLRTSYYGMVVETGENNYYDDSDFYAVVWNPITCKPFTVGYATTRAWTYPCSAKVDAPEHIMEAYRAYRRAEAEEKADERARRAAERTDVVGRRVRVVRGRKAKGTEGEVFWVGTCKYSRKARVGVRDEHGDTYWVMADQCEVA